MTLPIDPHHIIFERTERNDVRAIVFREDTELGAKEVFDIIELDPREQDFPTLMLNCLERSRGRVASIHSQWPCDLSHHETIEDRLRGVLEAFPEKAPEAHPDMLAHYKHPEAAHAL